MYRVIAALAIAIPAIAAVLLWPVLPVELGMLAYTLIASVTVGTLLARRGY